MFAKRAVAIGIVVAVVAATGLGAYWYFHRTPKPLQLPGTVEIQEVRLSSRIGGRVRSVSVRDGQLVKPGDVLAEFEAPELEAQREQARQRRSAAASSLERLLAGARPEEIAVAEAGVRAADAKV